MTYTDLDIIHTLTLLMLILMFIYDENMRLDFNDPPPCSPGTHINVHGMDVCPSGQQLLDHFSASIGSSLDEGREPSL